MTHDVFKFLFESGIGVAFVTKCLAIHAAHSRVRALPAADRLEIIERLRSIAGRHGLEILVCACKNPDISRGSCHLSGRWSSAANGGGQLGLFQG